MKKINSVLLVVLFATSTSNFSFAQYKLNIDNFWVYSGKDHEWKISIIDTTTLFDSLLYFETDEEYRGLNKTKNRDTDNKSVQGYIRKKKNGIFEELVILNAINDTVIQPFVYKENTQLGDKWIYLLHYKSDSSDVDTIWSEVVDIFEGLQFGEIRVIKEIHYKSGNPQGLVDYYKYFCDDFGELSERNNSLLKGCYINGIAYGDTSFIVVGVDNYKNKITNFHLKQNYPNPFNPSTIISYSTPKRERVKINVYDILGEKVVTLIDKYHKIGNYQILLNMNKYNNLSSGIYFYQLISESFSVTKKMIYLR